MRHQNLLLTFFIFIFLSGLTFGDDADNLDKEYLRKFGYLHMKKDSPFVSSMMSAEVITEALKNFQRMAGIEQTGAMNEETKQMMLTPRCGVSDLNINDPRRRRKRYALFGTKWNDKELTYKFSNYPKGIAKDKVETTIAKSFEYWQNVSSLKFKKNSGNAIIDIAFRIGAHGDDDKFDGPGGTLAHAFFPTQAPIGGDMHFDDEETWTFTENRGTNLLQVAVHELGHSLGLSHSEVQESIMAPFYRKYDPNLKLHSDDIRAIQKLYGPPSPKASSTPESTTQPPFIMKEGICKVTKPDAIFTFMDLIFVFKDDRLFVMDGFYDHKAKEYTASIIFPKLPSKINAAFSYEYVVKYLKYDFMYFFKDDKIWKYQYQAKPFGFYLIDNYPKKISEEFPGIPSNLDAAFEWNLNGRKYFFKDGQYYKFSDGLLKVTPSYPRPVKNWNLEIDKVDAVFNHPSKGLSETYFLSDGQIYKYDSITDKVAVGFPKSMQWLSGCQANDPVKNFMLLEITSSSTCLQTSIFVFIVGSVVQGLLKLQY